MSKILKLKEHIIVLFVLFLILILNLVEIEVPCVFYKTTGLYCPGCGITRMTFSLMKGNLIEAFKYNQLVMSLIILYLIYYTYVIFCEITNKKAIRIGRKVEYIVLVLTLVYWVCRNIEYFHYLRPNYYKK